jgi:hypothetical protein
VYSNETKPLVDFSGSCEKEAIFSIVEENITRGAHLVELAYQGIKNFGHVVSGFKLVHEPVVSSLNQLNATRFEFEVTSYDYRTIQTAIIRGDKLYVLSATQPLQRNRALNLSDQISKDDILFLTSQTPP